MASPGPVGGEIRTPDKRLRVFVSSTLAELAEERAAVARAIEALHLTPVMFELGARPHPPRELYRAYLAQSDVFVGLYWQRYGGLRRGVRLRFRARPARGGRARATPAVGSRPMPKPTLPVTGDPEADQLLVDDPLARLLGMLLDQQVPMEWAFSSPLKLKERLGGTLDAPAIAAMPIDELEAHFKGPPALHRYPGSMAKRTQQLCQHLVDHHGGEAEAVWRGVKDGKELYDRLHALPGFGGEKAKIFLALLAKRFGVRPAGWEEQAAPFSDDTLRSVADVSSAEALLEVRAFKKMMKAKGKGKDG